MRLIINGENLDSNAGTVRELLDELKIVQGRVAVEVNLSIIKKADYETCRLNDGDKIEIVNFVGGGEGKKQGIIFSLILASLRGLLPLEIIRVAVGLLAKESVQIPCPAFEMIEILKEKKWKIIW